MEARSGFVRPVSDETESTERLGLGSSVSMVLRLLARSQGSLVGTRQGLAGCGALDSPTQT